MITITKTSTPRKTMKDLGESRITRTLDILGAAMIAHCRQRGQQDCDHCNYLNNCRHWWDTVVVNWHFTRNAGLTLYYQFKKKVLDKDYWEYKQNLGVLNVSKSNEGKT